MQVGDLDDPVCDYRLSFAEAGTEFFARQNGEDVPITINEIENGDYVEFTYTLGPNEAIPAICPPPVLSPDTVTVLTDDAPDPGNTPGGTPEAPSGYDEAPDVDGNGDGAGLSSVTGALGETVDTLPDTGGASLLPAIAGAALVSAGGLLAYRKLRR